MPIVTCTLIIEDSELSARIFKGRIEKTCLEDVCPSTFIQDHSTILAIQLHQITFDIKMSALETTASSVYA